MPEMRALLLLLISGSVIAQTFPGDRVITSDSVVGSLRFSADGTSIAATCEDGKVRVWDTKTGKLQRALAFDKEAGAVALSNDGDLLAAAARDGGIQISDLKTGEIVRGFAGPTLGIRRLVFSPDRKLFAGAGRTTANGSENTVRIWDASGTEKLALPAGLGGISAMAISPDGQTLFAASFDTNLRAWRTRDGELLRLMEELPLATFAAAFSSDGKYLATAGADRIVYLWDTTTWKIARKLAGQPEMISAMAFSPDSRLLLTGGFSEFTVQDPVKVVLWDLRSGTALRTMPSAHMVGSAAFSPTGAQAATATLDRTISIWTVPAATGHPPFGSTR
jgi:WD40 repeat protein